MDHLASISSSKQSDDEGKIEPQDHLQVDQITDWVLKLHPLLESFDCFGNAKTVRNVNSSRFGKCRTTDWRTGYHGWKLML